MTLHSQERSRKINESVIIGILVVLVGHSGNVSPDPVAHCNVWRKNNRPYLVFAREAEMSPVPSPDGRMLAFEYFHSKAPNLPQVWIVDRDGKPNSAHPLVDDDNYNSWPSWSPDSQWLSFIGKKRSADHVITSQVYKVNVREGTVVQLTHFPKGTELGDSTSWSVKRQIAFEYNDNVYVTDEFGKSIEKIIDLSSTLAPDTLWGINWSRDGNYVTFRGTRHDASSKEGSIWLADSRGKTIRQVTQGPTDETPSWLDGQHILFERWVRGGEVRVCMVSLEGKTVQCLTRGHFDVNPRFDPTHDVIYFARGDIPQTDLTSGGFFPVTHIHALALHR